MLAAVGWGALAASSLLLGALLAFARPLARAPGRARPRLRRRRPDQRRQLRAGRRGDRGRQPAGDRDRPRRSAPSPTSRLDGLIAEPQSSGRGRAGAAAGRRAPARPRPRRLPRRHPRAARARHRPRRRRGRRHRPAGRDLRLQPARGDRLGDRDGAAPAAPARRILGLWAAVAAICALATVAGYAIADVASGELTATIDGFAAGALLVMLIDSMIPEATQDAGRVAGLVTTLGFAVATALSSLS